ncbi:glycosyltransferase [Alkaliflexus imshenetskii]|uniref:glycosyltransferase n=1 Tax=Alkaliflexus imshenetskii TaxID=286730 RepID=UPI001C54F301|nr:glycosyltransferase [Alkaliflexus imshenetskii]
MAKRNAFTDMIASAFVVADKESPPEIIMVTSYPPRECGIATYSQDLVLAINSKFSNSLSIRICALGTETGQIQYPSEVKYELNTSIVEEYARIGDLIQNDNSIELIVVQHEFGFFKGNENAFISFLNAISKPIIIVFHTVLPHPGNELLSLVRNIVAHVKAVVVMTHNSEGILITDYKLPQEKVTMIPHGTHLVSHFNINLLKKKYGLQQRKVVTTFGLLSSGKSVETTIQALPAIIKQCPEVLFFIIGKTHPEVVKRDGEAYRKSLEAAVADNGLQDHVVFVNKYLELPVLLEYLQLTDIYLFTTRDPNQAVSGTFVYAMSCGCPVVSTPIPHAREIITNDTGIIFDFGNSEQLAAAVILLLNNESLRHNISNNVLHKIVPTSWENSAIAHLCLFNKLTNGNIELEYNLPKINLSHIKNLTTDKGIIQFSKLNQPDLSSGYTLDDNSRALVAMCMYYKLTLSHDILKEVNRYLMFIKQCQQNDGSFLNYMDSNAIFTNQNCAVNLDDANGRAIWALGFLISLSNTLPEAMVFEAKIMIEKSIPVLTDIHSTRAMAFAIKGLFLEIKGLKYPLMKDNSTSTQSMSTSNPDEIKIKRLEVVRLFADRLREMYNHEHGRDWEWFEPYLTYANSIVPEAMLFTWILTGERVYKEIAMTSFSFLLNRIYNKNGIEVISNRNWQIRGQPPSHYGEQPIDVAYTIMTLSTFYDVFKKDEYIEKMKLAFNWFLGHNRLNQIVYNPCTGGCFDGLEKLDVNLNQGAESTLSYLMARITMEKYTNLKPDVKSVRVPASF